MRREVMKRRKVKKQRKMVTFSRLQGMTTRASQAFDNLAVAPATVMSYYNIKTKNLEDICFCGYTEGGLVG